MASVKTTPVANMKHKCCKCGKFVKVGQKYTRREYVGQHRHTSTCSACESV